MSESSHTRPPSAYERRRQLLHTSIAQAEAARSEATQRAPVAHSEAAGRPPASLPDVRSDTRESSRGNALAALIASFQAEMSELRQVVTPGNLASIVDSQLNARDERLSLAMQQAMEQFVKELVHQQTHLLAVRDKRLDEIQASVVKLTPDGLQAAHTEKLKEMQEEFAKKLQEKEEEFAKKLQEKEEVFAKKLDDLREVFDKQIQTKDAEYAEKMREFEQKHSEMCDKQGKAYGETKQRMKNDFRDVLKTHQDFLNKLEESHEKLHTSQTEAFSEKQTNRDSQFQLALNQMKQGYEARVNSLGRQLPIVLDKLANLTSDLDFIAKNPTNYGYLKGKIKHDMFQNLVKQMGAIHPEGAIPTYVQLRRICVAMRETIPDYDPTMTERLKAEGFGKKSDDQILSGIPRDLTIEKLKDVFKGSEVDPEQVRFFEFLVMMPEFLPKIFTLS